MISRQDWYLIIWCQAQIRAAPETFSPLTAGEATAPTLTITSRSWRIELAVLHVSFEFVPSETFFCVCVWKHKRTWRRKRRTRTHIRTHTENQISPSECLTVNFLIAVLLIPLHFLLLKFCLTILKKQTNKIKIIFVICQLWSLGCKNRFFCELSIQLKFPRFEMTIGHRRRGFYYWLIYFYMIQSSVYSVWRGTDGRSLALQSCCAAHSKATQLDFIQQRKIWPSPSGLKQKKKWLFSSLLRG